MTHATTDTATNVICEFANVTKTFDGEIDVVHNLTFQIRRGEFLTLLGPSGSGKTTTLMLLAGFETPTSGVIQVSGRDINRVPVYARGMGIVFQNYALFPHMTVAANIGFSLVVRKVPKSDIDKRITELLSMVGMSGLGGRRPAELSGGQQQRVALARALAFEPTMILLDEPLGALDKQLREQLQSELRRLHSLLGVTMLYVTHDQSEALAMSDRIAVLRNGVIQQLADPQTVYHKPANEFVASFIGESNSLPGVVVELRHDMAVVRLDNGTLVRARIGDCSSPGSRVVVKVRPEKIDLYPHPIEEGDANLLPGVIQDAIFRGDVLVCDVRCSGAVDLSARMFSRSLQWEWRKGTTAYARWQASDGLVFAVS